VANELLNFEVWDISKTTFVLN